MEQNEASAWYEFFSLENNRLKNYVRKQARRISDMDAEDIIAEVMVRTVSKLGSSGPIENIAGYVYRSIRNRIADFERGRAKSASLDGMLDEDGELPFLRMLEAENEEPFQAEEQAERIHRLTNAIGQLEPRQRAILIATELKGKSFRELSEAWGEPIGTLLSRKSRAIKTLRRLLEENEP
ncbi:MAG: sigma-70 family RNA polymerase sigma factor [Clostridiaceae bacterium]